MLGAAMLALLGLAYWFFHQPTNPEAQPGQAKKPPVPVVLTPVTTENAPVELKTIGNVESISSVSLKSQLEGIITSVRIKEGDSVQRGQLLFTLDTRPVEAEIAQAQATVSKDLAQVAQAQAQLSKDEAQVRQSRANIRRDQAQQEFAHAQEKRYATLLSQQFVSSSEAEQAVAASRSAEQTVVADRAALQNSKAILDADKAAIDSAKATVQSDQASLESSKIKLTYCYIRAPFSGRTGSLKVHVGDTVQTNSTPLLVLSQLNPIEVGFSIPEQAIESIRNHAKGKPFPVTVITRETPPAKLTGYLKFVENNVDTSTGTLRLKAIFANENHLWPGQFVDVSLQLAQQPNALVIPSQAIQNGQKGDYVFINQGGKAVMRAVIVDRVVNDMAVIRAGLALGDAVVTDGQFQLTPNAPIRPSDGPRKASTPSASPSNGNANNPASSSATANPATEGATTSPSRGQ